MTETQKNTERHISDSRWHLIIERAIGDYIRALYATVGVSMRFSYFPNYNRLLISILYKENTAFRIVIQMCKTESCTDDGSISLVASNGSMLLFEVKYKFDYASVTQDALVSIFERVHHHITLVPFISEMEGKITDDGYDVRVYHLLSDSQRKRNESYKTPSMASVKMCIIDGERVIPFFIYEVMEIRENKYQNLGHNLGYASHGKYGMIFVSPKFLCNMRVQYMGNLWYNMENSMRGIRAEMILEEILQFLWNEGYISRFRRGNAKEDTEGHDFVISFGDIKIPLQCKSSGRGCQKHMELHPDVPVVLIDNEAYEVDPNEVILAVAKTILGFIASAGENAE